MTMAIPAWTIREFLDMPKFREARNEAINQVAEHIRENRMGPPPVSESAAEGSDANPNHLADFTRLVDVAAQKRPQGGQT